MFETIEYYLAEGFLHVLPYGLDHILFITSLFFLNSQLRSVIIQCSIFTIAHTITIFLSSYQIVQVSSSIVEPIIALSILYTSLENIFNPVMSNWRGIIVFLFGLIHGLGFASALNELGISPSNFVASLMAFNVGVEIAQILIVFILYLCIAKWFSKKSWYKEKLVYPISGLIACISIYWTVTRIMG